MMSDIFRAATGCVIALFIAASGPLLAAELDPNDPDDALTIGRKIGCSTVDGEPITYWWHGRAYSRRMGERDKHLFNVEGMNVRSCTSVSDDEKGKGYKLVSREILLYKDPKTDEVLATWENPWTGETVDVLHVANDPVNFTAYTIGRDGKPATFGGTVLDGSLVDDYDGSVVLPEPAGERVPEGDRRHLPRYRDVQLHG